MMGKWKTCFKLLKYSQNVKRSIWAAIIFFLMGLGMFVGVVKLDIRFAMVSAILILLSFTILLQLREDLIFSAMVCTSSKRRFFDTLFSDVLLVFAGVAAYLIYAVMVFLFLENGNVEEFYAANVLWVSGLVTMVIMVFLPINFKYYWPCLITLNLLNMLFLANIDYLADARVSTPIGFWMGLGMVLAGGALSVVLRRILYKKPLSKWIVREYMKKMG